MPALSVGAAILGTAGAAIAAWLYKKRKKE